VAAIPELLFSLVFLFDGGVVVLLLVGIESVETRKINH
jgi:hypothetical protein